jgi:coenzyme F420-reducing hydrogenase beta subunit
METIYRLEDAGYTSDESVGVVESPDGSGKSWNTLFIRIEKPEKT